MRDAERRGGGHNGRQERTQPVLGQEFSTGRSNRRYSHIRARLNTIRQPFESEFSRDNTLANVSRPQPLKFASSRESQKTLLLATLAVRLRRYLLLQPRSRPHTSLALHRNKIVTILGAPIPPFKFSRSLASCTDWSTHSGLQPWDLTRHAPGLLPKHRIRRSELAPVRGDVVPKHVSSAAHIRTSLNLYHVDGGEERYDVEVLRSM